jgi:uncharacterized membrane protein
LIMVLRGNDELFKVSSREVALAFLGAVLYGSLSWIFNVVALPGVGPVSLRPVIVIPIFMGFVFGPTVGFFTGALGTILGDAITGWGVYPLWDIGNGFIGFIPGLIDIYRQKDGLKNQRRAFWICAAVMMLGILITLLDPVIADPYTGQTVDFGVWWAVAGAATLIMLLLVFAPQTWPYLLMLMVLGFVGFSVLDVVQNGLRLGDVVIWMVALLTAAGMAYLHYHTGHVARWVDHTALQTLVIWSSMGIIIGILYASLADIPYNNLSLETAFIGEFVPIAGPDIIFGVVLIPLLYGIWEHSRRNAMLDTQETVSETMI